MIRCLHCHAETSNGLALCELAIEGARMYLDYLPVYFRNLSRQRRPGRPNGSLGGGGGGGGDEGGSASVIAALGRAENDISTWARALAGDREVELPEADTEADTFAGLCLLLSASLTSIATLEWAGQFLRDITRHERILRELTETVVPGWYAGACRQPIGFDEQGAVVRCETSTYVAPGLTWATCQGCGATTNAADHLEIIIEEARDWVARPKALAEAVVAMVPTEQSVPRLYARIRQWVSRGDIEPRRHVTRNYVWDDDAERMVVADVEVGHARYRLGDVLDRVLAEGATRLGGDAGNKTPASA